VNLADLIQQLNHHKDAMPKLQITTLEDILGRLCTLCDSYHSLEIELPVELREAYDGLIKLLRKLRG